MTDETKWYDDRGNLYEFLDWLESEHCFDAEQIVRIVEKPEKWNREYALFREWQTAANPALRDMLSEAAYGTYETVEEVLEKFNSGANYD